MADMNELRAEAKALNINTLHMKKDAIEAAIAGTKKDAIDAAIAGTRTEPRARRVPLGVPSLKMAAEQRAGYHRHWMNDHKNRIHAAEQAGYQFVSEIVDGRDMRVSRRVGTHEDGSPLLAYLMEIRREFYDEDQAAKQAQVDEIDAAIMRRNEPNDAEGDRAGFYTPTEGTSMRVVT